MAVVTRLSCARLQDVLFTRSGKERILISVREDGRRNVERNSGNEWPRISILRETNRRNKRKKSENYLPEGKDIPQGSFFKIQPLERQRAATENKGPGPPSREVPAFPLRFKFPDVWDFSFHPAYRPEYRPADMIEAHTIVQHWPSLPVHPF